MIFICILLIVYFLAINLYGVVLLKCQQNAVKNKLTDTKNITSEGQIDDENVDKTSVKSSDNSPENKPVNDGKLFITAMLGGALGIFVFNFVFKYRLKSMFIMVVMPVIVALYGCLIYFLISNNYINII